MRQTIIRVLAWLVVVSIAVGLTACGGGGGGGSNSSSTSGTFTPDQANPGTDTISLSGAVSGADLYLTVRANSLSDSIYGAAFDLTFDPALLTYVAYTAGDFFEKSGAVTYAVATRSDRLIVGVSGQKPGASGAGAVVTFHFKAKASGSSATTFENQALCSTASTTVCDRQPSLSWYGGTYSTS
jgi:hypothetical protein